MDLTRSAARPKTLAIWTQWIALLLFLKQVPNVSVHNTELIKLYHYKWIVSLNKPTGLYLE